MTRHVKAEWSDDRLPELIETAEAVDRMVSSPGWEAITRLLAAEKATIDRDLDHGAPRSAEEYAMAHGRRAALGLPLEAARAIIEQAAARKRAAEQHERAVNETAREGTAA
jgi:hypothetical protein